MSVQTVLVAPGVDPRCPCGRRLAGLRVLGPAPAAVLLTVRCPRCRALVECVVRAAGVRRAVHPAATG